MTTVGRPQAESVQLSPATDQGNLLTADGGTAAAGSRNRVTSIDVDPGLPTERIAQALADLVRIQPALRLVFGGAAGKSCELMAPPRANDLSLESVEVPPADYADAIFALAEGMGRRPFDLGVGPACRFGVLRASDGSAAAILWCRHPAVADAFSTGPVIRDLDRLLAEARAESRISQLQAEREAAFSRQPRGLSRALGPDETKAATRPWTDAGREMPPLVLDPRPGRPAGIGSCDAAMSWELDETQSSAMDALCRRLAVNPLTLMTALYSAALARHGGEPSVLVGSAFDTRRTAEAADLCGDFAAILPVAIDVDWSSTIDEHIGATSREAVGRLQAHADVPDLPDRFGADAPPWSCIVELEFASNGTFSGTVRGARELSVGTPRCDLRLGVASADGHWTLKLEYDRSRITEPAARGVLGSLTTAVWRATADGSLALADLFTDVPHGTVDSPGNVCAHGGHSALIDWIYAAARRTPGAVAVEEPGGGLTYGALVAAADTAAAGLVARGVVAGDIVGLAPDSLSDAVVAMLAILRCGAAYAPLDAGLPPERLAQMVGQAKCRLIVGHGVDLPAVTTVRLPELVATDGAPSDGGGGARSAVYVMFTSGSTGTPKGVVMGQQSLLNLARWQTSALDHDEHTRFLQYAPLYFDVSYQEIIPTLAGGGTVVSHELADRRDFPALVRRVSATGVTHLFLPVAALRPFVQTAQAAQASFPKLRHVCVSGEQLFVDEEIRRFFAAHPGSALTNLYGPTETNAATVYRLDAGRPDWPRHVPIGRPLPGVSAYVVDDSGHLAPAGVPGELYLGGVSPAEGYFDEERTAANFLPDRFSGVDGARIYRTGDLVIRDGDGVLTFLGRRDSQVKVHGHRVELGEIESAALAADGARHAAAVVRGEGNDCELVLFLVAGRETGLDVAQIRSRLANVLPAYMVPSWIFETDSIPASRTGKIDRRALVALSDGLVHRRRYEGTPAQADYADDIERGLADIWTTVLAAENIVRDRSLLEYGAHSLNIMSALAMIQERYGTAITVRDFFRSPTVAALAEVVRGYAGEGQ